MMGGTGIPSPHGERYHDAEGLAGCCHLRGVAEDAGALSFCQEDRGGTLGHVGREKFHGDADGRVVPGQALHGCVTMAISMSPSSSLICLQSVWSPETMTTCTPKCPTGVAFVFCSYDVTLSVLAGCSVRTYARTLLISDFKVPRSR